jgi:hypothetical protein
MGLYCMVCGGMVRECMSPFAVSGNHTTLSNYLISFGFLRCCIRINNMVVKEDDLDNNL